MLSESLFPLWDSCAGVAPLPPCSRQLPHETVKTFILFPSCYQFLECYDNCMLSVPLSTGDLHYSRCPSVVICQGLSAGNSRCCASIFFEGVLFFLIFLLVVVFVLPTRLSARCLPSSRPDTASIRSCLLLPPGFLDTREAVNVRCWNLKVLQLREFVFGSSLTFIPSVCIVLGHLFGVWLGALEMCYILVR